MKPLKNKLCGILICALMLVTSCTRIANLAERKADKAAYGNIGAVQHLALGYTIPFSIDDEEALRVRELLEQDRDAPEPDLLSLSEALAISIANSRVYQRRKETLFIEALNLAEVQKDFNFKYSGALSAGTDYTDLKNGTSESFGETGADGSADIKVSRKLATGADVSLGFTQNALNYFTNPDISDINNALTFNIIQPLLNGFGPLVTKEPLRQAERNLIYEVRDFKRFQQDFVIDIAAEYYATLRARDRLINERKNYESTIANREQAESYAKAGRIADFQAAQARQSELNAADRWTGARADYHKALDDFRFTLALPVDLNVEPDSAELLKLERRGLVELGVTLADASDYALSNRLDLINQRQRVEDKERKVEIQKRNFLPKLNAQYNVTKQFDSADGNDVDQNLSVELTLPFDWTEKRNAYRVAQITLDRERRDLEGDESNVERTVRSFWRNLESVSSVYKNRLLSVSLAERRVENTTLLLKQGKALTRDLLDAQDDLLSSRNQATAALVDYTINRLRFWDAIERLEIDPKGMWYEQQIRTAEESVATP